MNKNKVQHKALAPWEYYYWSEIPYKQVQKYHKKDASRRQRHIENQEIKKNFKSTN